MSQTPSRTARRARIATGLLLAATVAGCALSVPAGAAPATPAASSAPSKASTVKLRADVVSSVNKIRAKHGCKPLKVAGALTTSAQRHANDMSAKRYFSHTSADGRSWVSRQRAAGWNNPGGENIARGFNTARPVMNAWMNSPLHRKNILNCSFRHIGVGFTASGQYWVQNFGY